ncbi:hypothetical protein ACFL0J_05240 [Candidatus Neomarinimicrobiota bacterium]
MNLRIRITCGVLLIVMVMTIVAGVIIWQQAKMQTAFQNFSYTSEIENSLLECRRQEKNYFLRKDYGAIGLFQSYFDTLFTLTTNLSTIITDDYIISELLLLKDNLSEYRSNFKKATVYDVQEYNRHYENSVEMCVMSARECHKIINRIRTMTTNQFNTALSVSSVVNKVSVVIGILLSVVISGFIADKVMDLIGTPEGEIIKYSNSRKKKS